MLSSVKILAVNSNQTLAKSIKSTFEDRGHQVITADNGIDAITIMGFDSIDLVITDTIMPVMDGFHLCHKIKSTDKFKRIPVVISPSMPLTPTEEKLAREMGPDVLFITPVDGQTLVERVTELLHAGNNPGNIPSYRGSNDDLYNYNSQLITRLEERNRELEKTTKNLEQAVLRMQEAQELANIGNWDLDLTTQKVTWSLQSYKIMGVEVNQVEPGEDLFLSRIHPDDLPMVRKMIENGQQTFSDFSLYARILMPDGTLKFTNAKGKFEFNEQGQPVRLHGILHDITDKVKANDELIKSEKRFRALIENSTDAIAMFDATGCVIYQSPAVKRMRGFSFAEMASKPFLEFTHPDDREQCTRSFQYALQHPGIPVQKSARMLHKNGHYIWVEASLTNLLEDENVKAIVFNYRDITERRQQQLLIEQGEANMREIIDLVPHAIFSKDYNGNFIFVNKAFASLYNLQPADLINQSLIDKIPVKDQASDFIEQDREVINTGIPLVDPETEFIDYKGEHRIFSTIKVPFTPTGLSKKAVLGVAVEITAQKQAEQEILKLNSELEARVEQRTAALVEANRQLESFSYSVSHDLRAPLRTIHAFSKMVWEKNKNIFDPEDKELFGFILKNATNMQNLIEDMLTFSRMAKGDLNKTETNMSELVRQVCKNLTLNNANPPVIKIGALPNAMADGSTITQVWVNFISNAIKYSAKNDKAKVEIGAEEHEDEVVYYVKDNGAGFDMKYAQKLFNVFQRLHSSSDFDGTGVGLAIVKRIIDQHNGRVWATAKVDEGAQFYFALPKK